MFQITSSCMYERDLPPITYPQILDRARDKT